MYTPNDILIRKTSDGETIWLSQRLIMELCGVSDKHLKDVGRVRYKQSLPKSWASMAEKAEFYLGDSGRSWRWGRKAGQYYYDYDRIPDRAPARYRSMLPSKDELIEIVESENLRGSRERAAQMRNVLIEAVGSLENNSDAIWINSTSGRQVTIAIAREYSKALAWCRLIKRTVEQRQYELFGAQTVAAFYELCAETLTTLKIRNMRVSTVASLRNKIASFPSNEDDQRRWIISGKFGNVNHKIVDKIQLVDYETGVIYPFDIHKAIMYAAYMNIEGPEKESLTVLYNEVYVPLINDFGIIPVKERTFCSHITRLPARLLNDRQRHGADYYNKQLLTYIPSEKLQYAHSLFCGDGSGLFAYRYINSKGKLDYMNLYAILITDVATGYIAGWAASREGMHNETPQMARSAVRMAAGNSDNKTMFEFVSDNHGAFTDGQSKEYFRDVFNVVRTIEAHNSQANPAETMFRLFKRSVLRGMRNFVRSSHNATIANRANIDKIKLVEYPTHSEALEQLHERIEKWNNTPRRSMEMSPAELFAMNKNPKCEELDPIHLRRIFGTRTKSEVARGRGFITVGSKGKEVTYEIPDYISTGATLVSRATGNGYYANVRVIYDDQAADLYSADGKYILTAERVQKGISAHAERDDRTRINQQILAERKQRQIDAVEQHENDVAEAFNLLEGWDYNEAVKSGGNKETINAQNEQLFSTTMVVAMKETAEKTRRKLVKKEQKQAVKQVCSAVNDMQTKHIKLLKNRLPEIYKQ